MVKGTFRQNVIRINTPFESKPKSSNQPTSPQPSSDTLASLGYPSFGKLLHPSFSKLSLSPSRLSETLISDPHCSPSCSSCNCSTTPKYSFISTHIPGVGGNYLEFCSHPLAQDVEIIGQSPFSIFDKELIPY